MKKISVYISADDSDGLPLYAGEFTIPQEYLDNTLSIAGKKITDAIAKGEDDR